MLSQEIRRNFLKYFKERGHTLIPSSPVVPHDDPTLLFANAGMNQFKDVFLGKNKREYSRAATSQKCIRVGGKHNDLDNVGHTARHLTFFEMLGNFSFGDYFKKEAIAFAWEVTTQIYKFAPEKLWITVFQEDEEALELWKAHMPANRIVKMGEKDNFWAMGEIGVCGPCSELYFDKGPAYGSARSPAEDVTGERYLEFWNLVFMQFNRENNGKLISLPKKSIDTGSGLERVVSLILGVDSVFATDILRGIIGQIEKELGMPYDSKSETAAAFHVIADHLRSLSFAISDGVQPSNTDRGYVLRKLCRRAVRYGKLLGRDKPFLASLLPKLILLMGEDYPELKTAESRIGEILTLEEESFFRTLKRGGNLLSAVIEKAKENPHKEISGEEAFKLKDTYGLPLDEILLLAKDANLCVNLDSYQLLEERAKEKSRSGQAVHKQEVEESVYTDFIQKKGAVQFVGFVENEVETTITGLFLNGAAVDLLKEGQEGQILLAATPFYAEKGGQVGDTGILSTKEFLFSVENCSTPYPGIVLHIGKVQKGSVKVSEKVKASIDKERRQKIANNHTATHLLHFALVQLLGPHIRQAGSLVNEERLRFDFNHHKPLTKEELKAIEMLVNRKIREDKEVVTYELSFEEVQKKQEIKQFFGEKYGTTVRVVDIDYSKELCGGTHTPRVGTIGYFKIAKESSIAAGVRRIEAVTGEAAEELVSSIEKMLDNISTLLKVPPSTTVERITAVLEEHKTLSSEIKTLKKAGLKELASSLKVELFEGIPCIFVTLKLDSDEAAFLSDELMHKHSSLLLSVATAVDSKCQITVRVSQDLIKKGISAGELIKIMAPCIGGGGGGRPDSATAGGKDPTGIEEAFKKAKDRLKQILL